MTHKGRVSPFGDPRIKACSQLPMAFRSVPRPSSPLGAKASTRCPFLLHTHARTFRIQRSEFRDQNSLLHPLNDGHFKPPRGQGNPRTVITIRQPKPRKTARPEPTDPQSFRPPSRTAPSRHPTDSRLPSASPEPPHKDGDPLPLHHIHYQVSESRGQTPETIWHPSSVLCHLSSAPVEANGIEPMTSCLQSRRSPN